MTGVQNICGRLESVDELSAVVAQSGWVLDYRQLNRGSGTVSLSVLGGNKIGLMGVEFEGSVHQQTLPPAGYVNFGLPSKPQDCGTIGRRDLYSESLTLFSAQSGMDACSRPGFSVYTVSIENSWLAECASHTVASDIRQLNGKGCVQRIPAPAALWDLRSTLARYMQEPSLDNLSPAQGQALLSEIESELPVTLLAAWGEGAAAQYVPLCNRSRVLRRSLAYLNENSSRVVTVLELCRESAASMSTLERAFRERFGLSPKRYMTALRLGGVRRSLIDLQETRCIADIAAQWGFWHMSKFAVDYRQMFGELPSATWRKRVR